MTIPIHGFPDWQDPLHTADLLVTNPSQFIPNGGTNPFQVFDMRAYTSYGIDLEAVAHVAATGNNFVQLNVNWTTDASGLIPVYRDTYHIIADGNNSGVFPSFYGRFVLNDQVHGPFMYFTISPNGPDGIDASWVITGNSRPIGRRFVRNMVVNGGNPQPGDYGYLYRQQVLLGPGGGAGATIPMAPGPASFHLSNVGSQFTYTVTDANGFRIYEEVLAAGGNVSPTVQMPRSAAQVVVINSGGVNGTFTFSIVSGLEQG